MTKASVGLFNVPVAPTVPVVGGGGAYPVHRIFCVGRNYDAHAAEMGHEVDRETPFYFTKPASAIVATGGEVPYPPETDNYHYEMELVVAIGAPAFKVSVEDAPSRIFGYACGLDMTRRDLQQAAREKGRPWDLGKAFEQSAVIAALTPAEKMPPLSGKKIQLSVNGETKQKATLDDLVWKVPELISHLSRYYHLVPGDLIYTGTPAGVGPVVVGDKLLGRIEGLQDVALVIGPAE